MADTANSLDPEGATAGSARASAGARLVDSFWRFFCSLRLTVVDLILLAAGCVVGMFYDQTLTLEEHRAQWAEAAWKLWLFERLELNDVFHSWWFGLLIMILALNLTACSFERLPKIWIDLKNPRRHLSDKQMRGIKHRYKTTIDAADMSRALGVMGSLFPKDTTFHDEKDGSHYAFKEKHTYARTGVYIVHIALLVIMFSAMAPTVFNISVDGMMMIVEDTSGRMVRLKGPGGLTYNHDIGFEVKCLDFRLKTFIDGAPMDFESDLEIHDPNSAINPVVSKTIQVNDPLEYKGYTFYQASYNPIPGDQMVLLDVYPRGTPAPAKPHRVAIGDRVQFDDGTAFVPIEIIREYGGLGGAVKVQKILPNGDITSFVVFRSYPEFDSQVRRGQYIVGFRGFDQQYATGIQVGKVPLIEVVFGGFVLMFIGMYMAFFMSQRRYWARLKDLGNGKHELVIAGAARRHQYAFEEEFGKIRTLLVQAFGESSDDKARALRDQRAKERAERRKMREQQAAEHVESEDRGGEQDTGVGMAVGIEDQDDDEG
jgi:cytochrome c biogenesis protein